jgi:hypothetical protein
VVGTVLSMVDASQLPLHDHHRWTVKLSETWNVGVPPRYLQSRCNLSVKVLGPFPIHAREQHFLSPSFPLQCK